MEYLLPEVANMAFGLVTKTGKVDLRGLLSSAMFGHYKKDIAKGVGIRPSTISDYMSGKSSMTTDNFEKIINFTFDKMKTYKLIKTRAGERTGTKVSEFYGTGIDDPKMLMQAQEWLIVWLNSYTALTDDEITELFEDFDGNFSYDIWTFSLEEEEEE